jgi:exosortase E/protease (VPEID-CTERM system)
VSAVANRLPVRPLHVRLALLAGLLVVEGGLLAARFDAEPILAGSDAWWVRLLGRAGVVMPLLLAVLTATVLLAGPRLVTALEASVARAPRRRLWPLLALHLAGYAAFFRLTAAVFEGGATGAWAALWGAAGLATGVSAAALALPGRGLPAFVRRFGGVLAATAAVGGVAWAAGQVTDTWWYPLGHSTMWMVYHLLALFARDPVMFPEYWVIGTRTFQVEVVPRCSGYEGIGIIWVFLAVYLWVFRRSLRFPRALLLVPIATVAIWLANALRLAALIGVGTIVSREAAMGGFHANSGSLLLCAVALGLGWVARRSPFFTTDAGPSTAAVRNPTAAHLAPLVALMATAMATGTLARDGFDPLYGLRVIAVGLVLWSWRREYARRPWRWSSEAIGVGAAVFVLWLALEPAPTAASGRTIGTALAALPSGWAALWLALRVAGAVVTVPLAEELAFRGYLAPRLMGRDFESVPLRRLSLTAIAVSSLLFGAMHDRLLAGTIAGVAYAGVAGRRGALADAVVAHATTNALLAAWVLATGSWWLW